MKTPSAQTAFREKKLRIASTSSKSTEGVSARIFRPSRFKQALILANGAGANMQSPFMRTFAEGLAARGILTVLFNFNYQEKGRKVPDRPAVLEETYRSVLAAAAGESGLPESKIAIGGKSMGGRIASQIAAKTSCRKLVFLGYPLHPPGQPEKLRDSHLYAIKARMLFVHGSRDPFCTPEIFEAVVARLPNARVLEVEGGGHSLEVPKRTGSQQEVYTQVLDGIAAFLATR
jgi:predicted alpha/beta-hydrolase family hydrolase